MLWKYRNTRRKPVSEKVFFHSKVPMRRQGGAVFKHIIFSVLFGTQDPWRIHRTDLQKSLFLSKSDSTLHSKKRTYIALHVSSVQEKSALKATYTSQKNLGPKVALKNSFRPTFFGSRKSAASQLLFHAWESAFAAAATRLCLNLAPTDPDKIDAWGLGGCWVCWARLFGPQRIAPARYFGTKKPIIVESESNWYLKVLRFLFTTGCKCYSFCFVGVKSLATLSSTSYSTKNLKQFVKPDILKQDAFPTPNGPTMTNQGGWTQIIYYIYILVGILCISSCFWYITYYRSWCMRIL